MEDSRIGQVTHMKFFLGNREKLEEQKANLNEIKTKAESHQKLLQNRL